MYRSVKEKSESVRRARYCLEQVPATHALVGFLAPGSGERYTIAGSPHNSM